MNQSFKHRRFPVVAFSGLNYTRRNLFVKIHSLNMEQHIYGDQHAIKIMILKILNKRDTLKMLTSMYANFNAQCIRASQQAIKLS